LRVVTRGERLIIGGALLVIGLLALAAGVIYLTVEGKSLPSILGQAHGFTGHRTKRGIAALIIAAILLLGGGGVLRWPGRAAS
jgi:amino acid permease